MVKEDADLDRLPPLHRENEHLQLCFRAAEILLDKLGGEVSVAIGLRAPFSTAATLRGVEPFMRELYFKPEQVHRLLQLTLDNLITVVNVIVKLGAAVSISDPVASGSLISSRHYREFALPYTQKLIAAVKAAGGSAPTLHICGNTKKIWAAMADTGAGTLSVEDNIDLTEIKQAVGDRVIIAGNIRPAEAMYLGKPADVAADVKKGLRQAFDSPKGYIVQLGCGLPIDTPPANIHALISAVRQYGRYPVNPERF